MLFDNFPWTDLPDSYEHEDRTTRYMYAYPISLWFFIKFLSVVVGLVIWSSFHKSPHTKFVIVIHCISAPNPLIIAKMDLNPLNSFSLSVGKV